ncbi:ZN414 protein, partial [Syrrhaptes paradoxus]|nr:ZN414 protein [Syrrhaptes paradoxus]
QPPPQPCRAHGLAGPPPFPAAGTQPFPPIVLDSVLGAPPLLDAGTLPLLRAPFALRLAPAPGAASPPALRAPPRLQRRLEEKPRCERQPPPPMLWLRSEHRSVCSRIVWEHTRGRYSCTQCPYSTASREEVTLHIEDHRKNPPPPPPRLDADMDFGVGIAPFHAKLPPEMENSLYSQL